MNRTAGDRYIITTPKIRHVHRRHYPRWWMENLDAWLQPVSVSGHGHVSLWPVDGGSGIGLRKAVAQIALFFKREFGYDFSQYGCDEDTSPRDRIFAVVVDQFDGDAIVAGAICFRWREWEDAAPGLALAWVWMHPYFRNNAILSAYWPAFRKSFGGFPIETPLSPAMVAFLKKRGECWRCGSNCLCKEAS